MDLSELIARESVRDAIARYAQAADRGRFEEVAALFSEEGSLEIEGREPIVGRKGIVDFLSGVKSARAADGTTAATRRFIRHHVSSVRIEIVAPGRATAASYFFVVTERGPDHWGRYRDDFDRIGGAWLFRRRRVRVDGRSSARP